NRIVAAVPGLIPGVEQEAIHIVMEIHATTEANLTCRDNRDTVHPIAYAVSNADIPIHVVQAVQHTPISWVPRPVTLHIRVIRRAVDARIQSLTLSTAGVLATRRKIGYREVFAYGVVHNIVSTKVRLRRRIPGCIAATTLIHTAYCGCGAGNAVPLTTAAGFHLIIAVDGSPTRNHCGDIALRTRPVDSVIAGSR